MQGSDWDDCLDNRCVEKFVPIKCPKEFPKSKLMAIVSRFVNISQVDWAEINAALGQMLLLVYTLAKKLNFKFRTFKLVPNGSFSRIERVDGDKAVYELSVLLCCDNAHTKEF